MGFVLRFNGAVVLILTSMLLWSGIAWAVPENLLNEELDSTTLAELPSNEQYPPTYERSTDDELLRGVLDVASSEETWTCPACGYENNADVNYCTKCGASLTEEAPGEKIYCNQCGAPSAKGSNFCTACGYAFEVKKPEPGATPAPSASRIGLYFTGGLASYGSTTLETEGGSGEGDMGNSWAAGGGLTVTLLTRPGAARFSLELSSDVGYSTIDKEFEGELAGGALKINLIPIRETALLSIAFGPRKMVKPFFGFGGGVGIMAWEFRFVPYGMTLDEGTSTKPLFDIPFGCEFYVTRNFALGVKVEYFLIPGDIEMLWPGEYPVNASAPDVFLVGGVARFCF